MKPLVSIIIPNFNSLKYIEETLNSVFNQTYDHIEIIIVDDGSTDGSFEYISALNNSNVKLFKNPGKGACAARNYGFSLVNGEYIQFLDSDDTLDTDKIKSQIDLLLDFPERVGVCSTKHFYEDKNKVVVTDTPFLFSTNKPQEFLLKLYGADGKHHNMVAQHAWLVPKHIIEKAGLWNENLVKDQDGEFFCRVVMASKGICYSENVFCYYRKNSQNVSISSGKTRSHLISQLRALDSKAKQLRGDGMTVAYKNAMSLQYKLIAINAYPEFKDLSKQALKSSHNYGGSDYVPVLGGRIIETIKRIFGWKIAKKVWHLVH